MQDKRIHIDKKFMDQSWAEMRKQLDLEMPVPGQQRRRFGWWWFGLVGLLLVSAGAGAAFVVWGKKAPATAVKTAQPIATGASIQPTSGAVSESPAMEVEIPNTSQPNSVVGNVEIKNSLPNTVSDSQPKKRADR